MIATSPKPRFCKLPEQACRDIASSTEVAEERPLTAAESATGIAQRQARDERTEPGLLEPQQRCLHQLLGSSELWSVAQASDDQIIERHVVGNQR